MKSPLDQSQLSEQESTKAKKGTTPWIVYSMIALVAIAAGYYAGTPKIVSKGRSSVTGTCEHGYMLTANCESKPTSSGKVHEVSSRDTIIESRDNPLEIKRSIRD